MLRQPLVRRGDLDRQQVGEREIVARGIGQPLRQTVHSCRHAITLAFPQL
jgi:hypothetical protein